MIFDEIKFKREKPINILFGTDWWSDCDDVAALDIMLKAHKRGLIKLCAIGVSSVMKYTAPSVRSVCEQHRLTEMPIGLDTSARRKGLLCLYQKKLASFCRTDFNNSDCIEGYELYRSVLVSLEDKAVIVDVGFPNLIMELLTSQPDEYSSLSGEELVKQKVSEIIIMGGRWDKNDGREYNFSAYRINREAANYICAHCPVPLTFLGYEVGKDIKSGGKEANGLTGIAYKAHFSPNGRPSWDPMTALFSIIGDAQKAGYKRIYGKASVNPLSGKNSFKADESGSHSYLVKTKENGFYKSQIDEILMSEE